MNTSLPPNNQIIAIVPVYTQNGEQTILYTVAKQRLTFNTKAITIIKHLAVRQSVDLYYLKANASKLTKSVIGLPLVLAPDLLLVPLKFRKPKINRDSTIGYFNFYEIKDSFTNTNITFIRFKNGFKLPILWKKHTVDEHLQRAHLVALAQRKILLPSANIIDSILAISYYQEKISTYLLG